MPKKITRKSKALKLRRKLKKETSTKRKYITKYKDIKDYFKLLNNALFNGKLSPFGQVEIKELKYQKCIGQVVVLEWRRAGTRIYKLEMLPSYPTKKDFLDTLVHEMVHLYQMQNLGDTGNHNKLFYSFRPKLNKLGLDL